MDLVWGWFVEVWEWRLLCLWRCWLGGNAVWVLGQRSQHVLALSHLFPVPPCFLLPRLLIILESFHHSPESTRASPPPLSQSVWVGGYSCFGLLSAAQVEVCGLCVLAPLALSPAVSRGGLCGGGVLLG